MILKSVKKTKLYNELSDDRNKQFFDRKDKQFLHNIDSLYYVVKVKNDWNHDEGCQSFLQVLELARKKAIKSPEPYVMFTGDAFAKAKIGSDIVMHGIGSSPYLYDFGKIDKYMVFVMGHQLNNKTPELWVQIRSENLWLSGEYASINESISDIEKILSVFDIEIEEIKENRIDYAYHTNYIQDPTNYFQPKNFGRMQESRFERWSLEGSFTADHETDTDYFTLGRKKSNNLFFRIYDKTKEVIEQGYKQFFIQLWYLNRMISYFDLYCIEKAFMQTSRTKYKYLDIARLEFYLEHGSDLKMKAHIEDLLGADNFDYEAIRKLADILVPRVTKILNVEIETKRKFYYSMDNSIDNLLTLKSKQVPEYARRLYLKLDNKEVFHDHLTCNNERQRGIIRFLDMSAKNRLGKVWAKKSDVPTSDFWKRLQKTKVNHYFPEEQIRLAREYQKTLSLALMKKKITNSISTYSLYVHGDDVQNDLYHDVLDYMSTLNENDIENAIDYKTKKITLLRNRLDKVEDSSKLENKFRLLDCETGETFKSYD